jgi:GR25 family glycosyltransferase involved in LPS biosynthesis
MAKPTKAYILKIDDPISHEYAETAAQSCKKVGLPYEYFMGFQNQTGASALGQTGINTKYSSTPYQHLDNPSNGHKAMCCSAGHYAIWKKISEGPDEAAILLEHDAIMLHPIHIDIPENRIVTLGYKLDDPSRYDHKKAGPPKETLDILGHEGAHAYAMTRSTAKTLVEEIEEQGIHSAVDNDYFLIRQRRTKVPLAIMSPTPAMGWLRKSTIWGGSAHRNYGFISSFQENYK